MTSDLSQLGGCARESSARIINGTKKKRKEKKIDTHTYTHTRFLQILSDARTNQGRQLGWKMNIYIFLSVRFPSDDDSR